MKKRFDLVLFLGMVLCGAAFGEGDVKVHALGHGGAVSCYSGEELVLPLVVVGGTGQEIEVRADLFQVAGGGELAVALAKDIEVAGSFSAVEGFGRLAEIRVKLPAVRVQTEGILRFRFQKKGEENWRLAGQMRVALSPPKEVMLKVCKKTLWAILEDGERDLVLFGQGDGLRKLVKEMEIEFEDYGEEELDQGVSEGSVCLGFAGKEKPDDQIYPQKGRVLHFLQNKGGLVEVERKRGGFVVTAEAGMMKEGSGAKEQARLYELLKIMLRESRKR